VCAVWDETGTEAPGAKVLRDLIYLHISLGAPVHYTARRAGARREADTDVVTYSQNFLLSDVMTRQVPPLKQ